MPFDPENAKLVKQQEYVNDVIRAHYERRLIHGRPRAKSARGFFERLIIAAGSDVTEGPARVKGKTTAAHAGLAFSGSGTSRTSD